MDIEKERINILIYNSKCAIQKELKNIKTAQKTIQHKREYIKELKTQLKILKDKS